MSHLARSLTFTMYLSVNVLAIMFLSLSHRYHDSPVPEALAFQNGLQYQNSDFRGFNKNDFSTSFVNLVTFGPVTLEFTRVNGIHPLVNQQQSHFRYAFAKHRHC